METPKRALEMHQRSCTVVVGVRTGLETFKTIDENRQEGLVTDPLDAHLGNGTLLKPDVRTTQACIVGQLQIPP